ncbi:sensor domain-containing diguanylate cyclase [Pseudodesulfovibrio sediminis]|uniref:diguanylate cyclase n=1 Tax=Pseudodesulfovibrio sediminis TaxID=2810563 RepID=A0ABM7P6Z6_9BACT|nr:GGDEF domain-containing protein [Pseudodesulfovibrio sediminis]BCS88731.1 diguanylate cyclase [Pseudodesulfovibrio sediminis]
MDNAFYRGLLDSMTDGVYFLDADHNVTFWNKAAERLSGYSADEVIGKSCADNVLRHVDGDGNNLCLTGCPMAATMLDGVVREANVFMHHKFGHRVPVFVRASPIRDQSGKIIGAVEVFSPNGEGVDLLKEMEALRKEALTDTLTGIGNRRYADISMERLDRVMSQSDVPFGVLFLDIDHFKKVNDTYGHAVGDKVLGIVAKTLKAVLRPLDVACRWGGEEFVVLVSNTTKDGLARMAERLRMLVENAWLNHEGQKIFVTVSIGGALAESGEPAGAVLERADKQTYLSKKAGRNCIFINNICIGAELA